MKRTQIEIIRTANTLRSKSDDIRHSSNDDDMADDFAEWGRELYLVAMGKGHKTESMEVDNWLKGNPCEIADIVS